jgi:hypothetical protein
MGKRAGIRGELSEKEKIYHGATVEKSFSTPSRQGRQEGAKQHGVKPGHEDDKDLCDP